MSDFAELQRKIFTRWINQKLQSRRIPPIGDVLNDLGQEAHLLELFECLFEDTVLLAASFVLSPSHRFPGKYNKTVKLVQQRMDNLKRVLDWAVSKGFQPKMMPSPSNIIEGRETDVLGFVWEMMMRFMKFETEDDSEGLSAAEALLKWCNYHLSGSGISVTKFKGDFRDGMALCTLIHKFRPNLIPDMSVRSAADPEDNLRVAFNAANAYFGLDEFITPAEFRKLDDKSTLVYISEYYYGINEASKRDLAGKRIGKLIQFTQTNDKLKEGYINDTKKLSDIIEQSMTILKDRKITNTMAGAVANLARLNDWKAKQKSEVFEMHVAVVQQYTSLSIRLAENDRPPFKPEGAGLDSLAALVKRLQAEEEDCGSAFFKELERQNRLVRIDKRHTSRYEKLLTWIQDKDEYLKTSLTVTSSGQARNELAYLDAFVAQSAVKREKQLSHIVTIGNDLEGEKFENMTSVRAREAELSKALTALEELATQKRPVLEDHLARELFKEKVQLWVEVHNSEFEKIKQWVAGRKEYLQTKENITSVKDAKTALGLLQGYEDNKVDKVGSAVSPLKKLGTDIREAKYSTNYSSWEYDKKQTISDLESSVDEFWEELSKLSAYKLEVLEDDLARELYAAETRLMAGQHVDAFSLIKSWSDDKLAYLKAREAEIKDYEDNHYLDVQTVAAAKHQLALHDTFVAEMTAMSAANVASLKQLGADILARKYDGKHSSYVYEKPDEVTGRESEVDAFWAELSKESDAKRPILEDHLVRNEFQEKVRLWVKTHSDIHSSLVTWCEDEAEHLLEKADIKSVTEAEVQLSSLDACRKEMSNRKVASKDPLEATGKDIADAKHSSTHSFWKYEKVAELTSMETEITENWDELTDLIARKQKWADDDLARERYAEDWRLRADGHETEYLLILEWSKAKADYLATKENISSVYDAKYQIGKLDAFVAEMKNVTTGPVETLKASGKEICAAEYKTEFSSWEYEKPDAITQRESELDAKWKELKSAEALKREILEDDLARELYAAETRLMAGQHVDAFSLIKSWSDDKLAYLKAREAEIKDYEDNHYLDVQTVAAAKLGIVLHKRFLKDKDAMSAANVASLKQLGADILARKYDGKHSSYVYEKPDEVTGRESEVDAFWAELSKESDAKRPILEDHLVRNEFQEKVRLWVENHKDYYLSCQRFHSAKKEYLAKKEQINSSEDARFQLALISTYAKAKANMMSSVVSQLNALGEEIRKSVHNSNISVWRYEHPNDVKDIEEAVSKLFSELDEMEVQKKAVLEDDLAREIYAEETRLLAERHSGKSTQLKTWAESRAAYLEAVEDIGTIADAQNALAKLDSFDKEQVAVVAADVTSLKTLGQDILDRKYETQLSTYAYEDPDSINTLEQAVESDLKKLSTLSTTKRNQLDASLKLELEKEDLRLQFANRANDFAQFVDDTALIVMPVLQQDTGGRRRSYSIVGRKGSVSDSTAQAVNPADAPFGATLSEIAESAKTIAAEDKEVLSTADDLQATYKKTHAEMEKLQITDNQYAKFSVDELQEARGHLENALKDRTNAFEQEKSRVTKNDEVSRDFAGTAVPLVNDINASMFTLLEAKPSLNEQLQLVESKLSSCDGDLGDKLKKSESLASILSERKVTFNEHTTLSLADVNLQFDFFKSFLGKKKTALEADIEHQLHKGVSKEQVAEIDAIYREYDRDQSGSIDKKELKAALFSLGEETTKSELQRHVSEFGNGQVMTKDQFMQLMLTLLGDVVQKDTITASFETLTSIREGIKKEDINSVLDDSQTEYIVANASTTENGNIDWKNFAEKMFSR